MSNTSCATYLDNAVIAIANIVLIQSTSYIRPNITGDIVVYTAMSGGNSASGAFTLSDAGGQGESSSYRSTKPRFTFNASNSNAIYAGATIQPNSGYTFMIIRA